MMRSPELEVTLLLQGPLHFLLRLLALRDVVGVAQRRR